ncbi:class I SAM-dependent methyltransferase [Ktedonospora formicarum]|uniref:SAM-dependent methyltransferase n=1 Tax=Ktedonospora formicarum TaxID=2778364 RepID=A0A8J3MPC3_9CHLR|nr:class I SAM-dependent methyltransferase [Ktedonospora formicarum]GHO43677.1 SAM-dependent methyltransferase [Ktedonospora formicarum]
MPLRLTPLEALLGRLHLLPVPLFDTPLAPGIAKMLVTACEIGLFESLSKQQLSTQALAERLECHPDGLQLLLNLLVSAGYLRRRKGRYANTRMSQRWLTSASSLSIAPYIIHSPDIVAIWNHIDEVIRTNSQAMRMPYEEDASSPEQQAMLARHYAGLASLATALGSEVIRHVRLPHGSTRLLDVGGSHAAYSALFCHKYPYLNATILDIEAGLEAGRQTAKVTNLEERMSFVSGDIVQDDFRDLFAEPFDVALYFHIAHLLQPELNQTILRKVVGTLRPGGTLIFVDQVTDQTHGSHLASLIVQFMALTMTTCGGTCYSFTTVKDWLEKVGMHQVRSYRLLTPGASLITAIKQ